MVVFIVAVASEEESGNSPELTPATEVSQPEPETVTPEPDGTFSLNCDYLLGDFSEGTSTGYRLIAGGPLKSTGNIGLVVEAKAKWQILGSAPIVETEKLRLAVDEQRTVKFSVPITQDQVDAHQSADGQCSSNAEIVDVFGKAQG